MTWLRHRLPSVSGRRLLYAGPAVLALFVAACQPPASQGRMTSLRGCRDPAKCCSTKHRSRTTAGGDTCWRAVTTARRPRRRHDRVWPRVTSFYSDGSGSDGMIEMELCLERGIDHPLVRLTLAQLYLMAGQGEPNLLPVEGPAADTGDWHRNRRRLLQRARTLLESVGADRPDDAAVDYLLADVARAEGDVAGAADLEAHGYDKCTGGVSFDLLRRYQDLNRYPARLLALPTPEYPQAAVEANLSGPVVLDLLLDPAGRVRQTVTVRSPGRALTDAAVAAFRDGGYEPARIGKYPVWAWLRVTTSFNLSK